MKEMTGAEIIKKYNIPVPRYTSYPPANLFSDKYTGDDYRRDILESNRVGSRSLSFYIHIPFCKNICHFCACNRILLPSDSGAVATYIDYLHREFELVRPLLDPTRPITQIHFGGGSPTAISLDYIGEVIQMLTDSFAPTPQAEVAIEVHPGFLTYRDWDRLIEMPFTRYSIGLQDLHTDVLKMAGRIPPRVPVGEVVGAIHDAGKRVNLDLVYGLPGQSVESFEDNIAQALEMRPDRLVTFSYAHVPWLHPGQKILEQYGLPAAEVKQAMYDRAARMMTAAGYVQIGLDHFVLPDDPLAVALQQHSLHRNFQGYCPRDISGQVYGLGVTGIAQLHDAYAQNIKTLSEYYSAIDRGQLPTHVGYKLSREECLARDLITDLMCNYRTAPLRHATGYGLELKSLADLPILDSVRLEEMIRDGLVQVEGEALVMNPEYHPFVRNIASCFDIHYSPNAPRGYSRPI